MTSENELVPAAFAVFHVDALKSEARGADGWYIVQAVGICQAQ